MYYAIEEILNESSKIEKDCFLDGTTILCENVEINVFGVLHGLTGGTNKEYVDIVNNSIEKEKKLGNVILSEKSMKKMYKNIDYEVDDFVQLNFFEVFCMTINMLLINNFLLLIKSLIKEKVTKKDRFNSRKVKRLQDIGGSIFFHKIDPNIRRKLAGFPSSSDYLRQNFNRRKWCNNLESPNFVDNDWAWLKIIEPFACIPIRSIHMLEYSILFAKKNNIKKISLFVGETHNSDIFWYSKEIRNKVFDTNIEEVKKKTKNYFESDYKIFYKTKYLIGSVFGALFIISFYLWVAIYLTYLS